MKKEPLSLFETLRGGAQSFSGHTFLVEPDHDLSYQVVCSLAMAAARRLRTVKTQRLYLYARDSAALVVALFAADLAGLSVCVLNRRDDVATVRDIMGQIGAGFLLTDHPQMAAREGAAHIEAMAPSSTRHDALPDAADPRAPESNVSQGSVVILTTGTTGQPKAVLYSWPRLLGQMQNTAEAGQRRWLLTYPLNHFAGIQMALHTLVNGHTLVIPRSRRFEDVQEAIHACGVDAISGTPTFWRMFLGQLKASATAPPTLKQITLGGEASTPELLAGLKRDFPQAAITQVYATTELGACFAVSDGQPGFPASFLERRVGNVRLKIVDGELYVQSQNRMLGYVGHDNLAAEDGWSATGDVVEQVGERVYFRGRKSEIINVGGYKVHPGKVEAVILQVDGVQAVRVFGQPNPITGQLVSAALEAAPGADPDALIHRVRQACALRLARAEQPRVIEVSDALQKRNNKLVRSHN